MKTRKIVTVFAGMVVLGMVAHGTWNPMSVSILYKHLTMFVVYAYTIYVLTGKRHG